MKLYPLRFQPLYQERVWGGRRLADLYGRTLPSTAPTGESWEIADREGAESVVANGPLAGRTLGQLLAHDAPAVLGAAPTRAGRFPLLVKILDARDVLSLQVHPPKDRAADLGGESKTEMWYVTAAEPGAEVLAGLRRGVTRAEFERRIADGTVDRCFHRLPVQPGDALFLPSGRVHALGAGIVLFEIQENSDTTYRVFDWNRVGLDGRPRALHVRESLESIDFADVEPALIGASWRPDGATSVRPLVENPLFRVEVRRASAGARWNAPLRAGLVLGVVRGEVVVEDPVLPAPLRAGDFCLVPAAMGTVGVVASTDAEWLAAEVGGCSDSVDEDSLSSVSES